MFGFKLGGTLSLENDSRFSGAHRVIIKATAITLIKIIKNRVVSLIIHIKFKQMVQCHLQVDTYYVN